MICQPKQYWDSAIIEPFLSHLVQPSPNKNISHCSRDQVSGGCYCLSIVIFVVRGQVTARIWSLFWFALFLVEIFLWGNL